MLDCCQGDGLIWQRLRAEFNVASYWGMDRKASPGRLQVDSVRVLSQAGWPATVVDVDVYGAPWKHWAALLPNVRAPLTVFLTVGQVWAATDNLVSEWIGLGKLDPPRSLRRKIQPLGLRYCLAQALEHSLRIVDAIEAVPTGFSPARYIGVRLEPVSTGTARTTSPRTRTRAKPVGS